MVASGKQKVATSEALAINGAEAVAYAMRQAELDVVAAYPITPQTLIIEKFSEYVADGLVHTEFVEVESEHAALSAEPDPFDLGRIPFQPWIVGGGTCHSVFDPPHHTIEAFAWERADAVAGHAFAGDGALPVAAVDGADVQMDRVQDALVELRDVRLAVDLCFATQHQG